jgi:predicted amidophosphoribosyltransferase
MDHSCKICNAKIPDGSRFCPQCATPITLPKANNITLIERTKNLTPPKPGISTPPAPGLNKKQVFKSPPLPISPQLASNLIPAINANAMSDRFARYWAKGVSGPFACWKFSNISQAQAQQLANERVLQIAEKFRFEKNHLKNIYTLTKN